MEEIEFPAAVIVHCPTGPVPCCIEHATAVIGLMQAMGAHAVAEPTDGSQECTNCRNKAKTEE